MPWWLWALIVWLSLSLVAGWYVGRWFRWLRGDFD